MTNARTHTSKLPWQHGVAALQFLTILPWGRTVDFDARAALPYFPLCGLLIGALAVLMDFLAGLFWTPSVVAFLDIIFLVIISGALHLDGLADTADGLYGQRQAAHALAIMKDSRVGAMGLVAVLCCLAAKWAGLAGMAGHHKLWLLLIPAYSRAGVLFGIKLLPYGRPDGGTGKAFFSKPLGPASFWGVVPLGLLSLLLGWQAITINLGAILTVGLILIWFQRKIGIITGDMLGALIEMTEAGLFILAAAVWVGT